MKHEHPSFQTEYFLYIDPQLDLSDQMLFNFCETIGIGLSTDDSPGLPIGNA
jgi:hypothetical protein